MGPKTPWQNSFKPVNGGSELTFKEGSSHWRSLSRSRPGPKSQVHVVVPETQSRQKGVVCQCQCSKIPKKSGKRDTNLSGASLDSVVKTCALSTTPVTAASGPPQNVGAATTTKLATASWPSALMKVSTKEVPS